jgi:hypothetical protein
MRDSLLFSLSGRIFSETTINRLRMKRFAGDPVSQASELLLVILQIILVVKQELCKLRQDFPLRMVVLQLHERPGATTVFKGSTSFACSAHGVRLCRIKGENLFETNFVLPLIGQIVLVQKGLLEAEVKIMEVDLMGIIVEDHATNSPDPIRLPPDKKLMQMLIRPAEYHLEDLMQLGNSTVASHEQTTPDLRANLSYPDAQLIDLNCCVCTRHPCISSVDLSSFSILYLFRRFLPRGEGLFTYLDQPGMWISSAVSPRPGMVCLFKWWVEASMPYPPEQMETIFQQLALPGVWSLFKET